MKEYTEGIAGDGAVILEDGVPITVTRILELLNASQKIAHNSDYAKYKMYQCPYDKACRCKMTEPCNGCETYAEYFV